jgi:tetratricopeptide (TPR) repeat protein
MFSCDDQSLVVKSHACQLLKVGLVERLVAALFESLVIIAATTLVVVIAANKSFTLSSVSKDQSLAAERLPTTRPEGVGADARRDESSFQFGETSAKRENSPDDSSEGSKRREVTKTREPAGHAPAPPGRNVAPVRGATRAKDSKAIAVEHELAGLNAMNRKDWLSAIQEFTKALARDNTAYVRHHRGLARYRTGDVSGALEDATIAIRMDPYASPEFYNARGVYYSKQGAYRPAIADATKSIEMAPTVGLYHYNRGLIYYEVSDFRSAAADLRKAEELGVDGARKMLERLQTEGRLE